MTEKILIVEDEPDVLEGSDLRRPWAFKRFWPKRIIAEPGPRWQPLLARARSTVSSRLPPYFPAGARERDSAGAGRDSAEMRPYGCDCTRTARKSLTLVSVGPVTTRSPSAEKKP